MFLSSFEFPSEEHEIDFYYTVRQTCFNTYYPFGILSKNQLSMIEFKPITIFYGGNGSGKTTALNVIAEKLGIERTTLFNRSSFFEDYLRMCDYDRVGEISKESRIITSDDVFDFMLNLRTLNEGIDQNREELMSEYWTNRYTPFRLKSLDDYELLKRITMAQRKRPNQSEYVRRQGKENVREYSNGESAHMYFMNRIKKDALYLLDEPENSLSPEKQMELTGFLLDSARFYNCQFIIATHSPFVLALKGAKIYDFDANPVEVKRWTELGNVRTYYSFFKNHEAEFED